MILAKYVLTVLRLSWNKADHRILLTNSYFRFYLLTSYSSIVVYNTNTINRPNGIYHYNSEAKCTRRFISTV